VEWTARRHKALTNGAKLLDFDWQATRAIVVSELVRLFSILTDGEAPDLCLVCRTEFAILWKACGRLRRSSTRLS
jgi:hypothetical protein